MASRLCRYLGQEVFLHYEDKGLVKVRVEICVLNRSFLLLPDPLALGVEELYLDVGIRGAGDVHLLQLLTLQDSNGQLDKIEIEISHVFIFISMKIHCTNISNKSLERKYLLSHSSPVRHLQAS